MGAGHPPATGHRPHDPDQAPCCPVAGLKAGFSRFFAAVPGRLHAAAHSHHPWPDVTFAAHRRAWLDAATLADHKWDRIWGAVLPEAQRHVARRLGLPDSSTVVFAPNTHELVVRLLSCLPVPASVLTTDGEFHSFERQARRLEENGRLRVRRVATTPAATFTDRFVAAVADGGHHLVFFSQVFFDSGGVVDDLARVVAEVPDADAFVVVDGYHGFMALPTDLSQVSDRVFYLAGGYKYAMAGEGAVFMHCPAGYGPRPANTGWFAAFDSLEQPAGARVVYPQDGRRFSGATFDPVGLYRFNAVQRWLADTGVTVADIHGHVAGLQHRLISRLSDLGTPGLAPPALVIPAGTAERAHFLAFRLPTAAATPDAAGLARRLADRRVVVDHRGDRLRIGLGCYHDPADVDELAERVAAAVAGGQAPA